MRGTETNASAEWLSWNPKVGRSRRSTLVLNHHLSELKELLASKRILAGKYQQALTILEQDQMTFDVCYKPLQVHHFVRVSTPN